MVLELYFNKYFLLVCDIFFPTVCINDFSFFPIFLLQELFISYIYK